MNPRDSMDWSGRNNSRASAWRWVLAAAVVITAHVIAIWTVMNRSHASAPSGGDPIIMIDLTPVSSPQTISQDLAPGPVAEKSDQKPDPESAHEPEVKISGLPQMQNPEAVAASPEKPKSREEKAEPNKSSRDKPKAKQAAAQKPTRSPVSDRTAGPISVNEVNALRSAWVGQVVAHLNRNKRVPADAAGITATARVQFTVSRSGQVGSTRLLQSSGDTALDREAVALVHRSSPMPAPPPQTNSANVPVELRR